MGPCTPFYPDVPKVLVHAVGSPPREHFSSWGSLAPCKALTLHCTASEGNRNPSLSPGILPAGAQPTGDGSGVLLHPMNLPHFSPKQGGRAGTFLLGGAGMMALGTQTGGVQQQTCVLDGKSDHGWGSDSGQVLGLQKSLCSLGCVPRLKPHAQSSLQCCYSGCDRACATSSLGTALLS